MLPLERAGFLAHSRTRGFLRREQEALAWLDDALTRHRAVVSWSGGKDSGVVMHLCNRLRRTPGALLDSGGEHPLSRAFTTSLAAARGWPFHVEVPRLSYVELLELAYEFGPNSAYLPPGFVREFIIYETSEAAAERWGADAYLLGLRDEESRARAMTSAVHGTEHLSAKSGLTRLLPLTRWRTEDVLAYHAKHDLPLHPAYTDERLPGERITDIRVGVITNPVAEYTGPAWAKLRRFHPAVFQELRRRLPSVPWPV